MMKSAKILLCAALFLLCSTHLFAWTYTNQELGFSAALPDGYSDISSQMKVKALVSQGKMDPSKTGIIEMIAIQDLGAPIGRDDLSKTPGKPENVKFEKTAWKSFSIDLFSVVENVNSISFLTLNAQVPLKPHAIQITVAGPATDEARLRAEMQQIVASVDGPTNWLMDDERQYAGTNWIAVLVGIIVMITGRLRISKHYGVIGTGARIGGFFILILGFAVPPLAVLSLRFLASQGIITHAPIFLVALVAWIAFYWVAIWAAVVMLVKEYGNAYADDAEQVATANAPTFEPPKVVKRFVTHCRMCQVPIPPEQQETVRACPSCGADLTLAR